MLPVALIGSTLWAALQWGHRELSLPFRSETETEQIARQDPGERGPSNNKVRSKETERTGRTFAFEEAFEQGHSNAVVVSEAGRRRRRKRDSRPSGP